MFHINYCWLSVELDGITLPLFLVKTLNIGFSLDCFIMFHLSIAVIKVYATIFRAAVHFHDESSYFVELMCGNMGSYDHLTPIYISFFPFVRYQIIIGCYI